MNLDDCIKCAEREAAMRRRVYPKWIEQGKLKKENADREIATMTTIAELLLHLKGTLGVIPK